MNSQHLSLSVT